MDRFVVGVLMIREPYYVVSVLGPLLFRSFKMDKMSRKMGAQAIIPIVSLCEVPQKTLVQDVWNLCLTIEGPAPRDVVILSRPPQL